MKRTFCILGLCLYPVLAAGQEIPLVSIEIPKTETLVGQPLIVRIKVLVPTFSPKAPEFPSLEVPGLIVRLPERASAPVSERINGETWSGVQRSYRLYPLQTGAFEIPAQTVRVAYAEPGGIEPIFVDLQTTAIRFNANVPPGAENLDSLIIAQDFSLTQTLDLPETFEIGDAIVRTVEAKISGTTPILIPSLITPMNSPFLREYPKDPRVSEVENRGILSGTRSESATYLAAAPGEATLPPITFEWFSLTSNQIETASVDGTTLAVTGEIAASSEEVIDWRQVAMILVGLTLSLWGMIKVWPKMVKMFKNVQSRLYASEPFAFRSAKTAIRRRDLSATYDALNAWWVHFPNMSHTTLDDALARVGAADYKAGSDGKPTDAWPKLHATFLNVRRACLEARKHDRKRKTLPPINSIG